MMKKIFEQDDMVRFALFCMMAVSQLGNIPYVVIIFYVVVGAVMRLLGCQRFVRSNTWFRRVSCVTALTITFINLLLVVILWLVNYCRIQGHIGVKP